MFLYKSIFKKLRWVKTEFLLIIILLFALGLRLIFFAGVNTSDDAIYYNSAHDILIGNFKPGWVMNLRVMLLYPVAFFFWLFGINNFSAGLWPLICSLGTLVAIYKIGEMMFNKKVGLLAAFLFSFYPLEVIYGTRLAADIPTEFFVVLSVFLFLKGLMKKRESILFFSVGVAAGLSYLVKELGLLVFVFYLAYIIFDILKKRKINWNYFFIFLGFLSVFALEGLYYYSTTGDFLQRFHESIKTYGVTSGYWGKGIQPIDIFTFYPPAMLNLANYYPSPNTRIYGFFFYFVIIAIAYFLIKKEKKSYILILWLVSLFLYLQIGTRSISQYLIFGKEMRFLTLISAPALILVAAFFLSENKLIKKFIQPISILFLFFTSIYYSYFLANYLNYGMGECGCLRVSDIKHVAEFVKSNPTITTYVDSGVYDNIRFFLAYNTTNLKIANSMNKNDIKNAYVVVNTSLPLLNSCTFEREKSREIVPDFLCKPPEEWKLIKIIGGKDGTTNREYNPAIFYAE